VRGHRGRVDVRERLVDLVDDEIVSASAPAGDGEQVLILRVLVAVLRDRSN